MTDLERGARLVREIDVRHVSYEAPEMGISWWKRVTSLQAPWQWFRDVKKEGMSKVLSDVSFKVCSGQLLAIMGESSGGKSSLLDIIARRPVPGKVRGKVLFDGEKSTLDLVTSCVAYVRQDDRLLPYLTVQETLTFVAHLKMDRALSNEEINKRVESVLWELGLYQVRNTKVGGAEVRGVSGGERKRVSIGFQLLQNPSVLLLDEPTSGLDSFTAHHLVETLQILAKHNRIVIMSIHQPRSDIFAMFDLLLLLSQGHTLYLGDPASVVPYFSQAGYPCPELTNPGDFYVDLTTPDPTSKEREETSQRVIDILAQYYKDHSSSGAGLKSSASSTSIASMDSLSNGVSSSRKALLDDPTGGKGASRPKQFYVLLRRAVSNKVEDYGLLGVQSLQALYMSCLIGMVYFQLSKDQSSITDRFAILYILGALYPYMVILDVILYYHKEKCTLYNELQDGLYTCLPYFLAKIISEIPEHAFFTLLYSLPVYFLAGLQPEAGRFFQMYCMFFLVIACSRTLGLVGSALLPTYQMSALFSQLIFTFFLLCTGFIFNLDSLFVGIRWLRYVSYLKWGYQSLCLTELPGLNFTCPLPIPDLCINTGQEALQVLTFDDAEVWHCGLILLAQIVILISVFYITMRFVSQKPQSSS